MNYNGLFLSVINGLVYCLAEGFVCVFLSLKLNQVIRRLVAKDVKMTPIRAEQADEESKDNVLCSRGL